MKLIAKTYGDGRWRSSCGLGLYGYSIPEVMKRIRAWILRGVQ